VVLHRVLEGAVGRCKSGIGKIRSRELPGLHDPEDGPYYYPSKREGLLQQRHDPTRPATVRYSVKLAGIPTKPASLNITALCVGSASSLQLNEHPIPVIFQTSGPQMLAHPPPPYQFSAFRSNLTDTLFRPDVWLTVHRNSVWIRKTN